MDSSQTTPPETDSSSSPTPLPTPDPAPTPPAESTAPPPLRVKNANPIPSSTTPSEPSASAYAPDPVDSGNTPSSSPAAEPVRLKGGALVELARGVVLTASMYVQSVLARTDTEKAQQVWLADDDDQAQIGDPLADIVQRKGLTAGVVNQDMAALIEASIGIAAYAVKNVKKVLAARRLAKQQAGLNGGITQAGTSEPA